MSGNRSKSAFFEGRGVTSSAYFRGNGASPINHCWCHKSRVIAVSRGIKMSAETDGPTDGQISDSNAVRCITCSRMVKTRRGG